MALTGARPMALAEGTWRSIASSREMWLIALYFARFMATLQPAPAAVKGLTPSVWAAFKLSRPDTTSGPVQLRKMATFLRDHPRLPHETRLLMLTQRILNALVRETAYSGAEFDELKKAAARRFRAALQRIRHGREHLERWRAGQFAPATREHQVSTTNASSATTSPRQPTESRNSPLRSTSFKEKPCVRPHHQRPRTRNH